MYKLLFFKIYTKKKRKKEMINNWHPAAQPGGKLEDHQTPKFFNYRIVLLYLFDRIW